MLNTAHKNVKKEAIQRIYELTKIPKKTIRDVLIAQQHAIVDEFLASDIKEGEYLKTDVGVSFCYKRSGKFGFQIVTKKSQKLRYLFAEKISNSNSPVAEAIKALGNGISKKKS